MATMPKKPRFFKKHFYVEGEPLCIEVTDYKGIHHRLVIPVGFRYDGASIPEIAWRFIGKPWDDEFWLASAAHDYYCELSLLKNDYQLRVIGDAVFFCLLERSGVPTWKRTCMYLAVRAYSRWTFWRGK